MHINKSIFTISVTKYALKLFNISILLTKKCLSLLTFKQNPTTLSKTKENGSGSF